MWQPPDRVARSFAEFAERIHSERPVDGGTKIDLHVHPLPRVRKLCGDHGRVIPTRQDLCPKCGGIVIEVPRAEWRAEMRRLTKELGTI